MKLRVYAIHDSAAGYLTPVVEQNDAVAMRNFEYACENGIMASKPGDFHLMYIGDYDTDTGDLSGHVPELICSASDFVRKRGKKNE